MHALRRFVTQLEDVNKWIRRMEGVTRELEVQLQVQRDARQRAETREKKLQLQLLLENTPLSYSSETPPHKSSSDQSDRANGTDGQMDSLEESRQTINDLHFQLAVSRRECEDLRAVQTELESMREEYRQTKRECHALKQERREWKAARSDVLAKKEELQRMSLLRSQVSQLARERDEARAEGRKVRDMEAQVAELALELELLRREKNSCRAELDLRTRERDHLLQDRDNGGPSLAVALSSTGSGSGSQSQDGPRNAGGEGGSSTSRPSSAVRRGSITRPQSAVPSYASRTQSLSGTPQASRKEKPNRLVQSQRS
eukprot:CAMPEP_0182426552 /NCGR_PEP_ID=MMETSP1167-20130531/13048_1 /TAXON_ID=2988 /ORGANISM="Mallomonas Sp, Strain CCMP3275" /LENGTH=314 /DNA_ID=CAMNT_0024608055 /DNA_START=103 /DNA_END=1044 /DNA_ORIENTATION=-